MSRTDSDITAIRELPPGLAEPTDESVARTWHRLASRRVAFDRPRSRFLVPITAAAVVTGLAIGAAVVFAPSSLPFGSPATGGKTAEANLAPAAPEAVAALHALAEAAAGSTAASVAPGQLIYVKHDGWAASFRLPGNEGVIGPQQRELWVDPQGMIVLSIKADGVTAGEEVDQARERLVEEGPSLSQPTPQWLASLPTDPATLLAELRGAMGEEDAWSTDHQVWTAMQEFYSNAELLLSPQVRAALLRAFTGLRGITSSEVTIDGRRLVAIRHTEQGNGDEILFDPATGQAVGRRSLSFHGDVTLVPPSPGPTLDQGVTYQSTWTQTVVATVGATS